MAEKFQTGFDQPLLHTMYVDKVLVGPRRRADALAAQPHPPAEGRHLRARLPQRRRGHPGGVRALLRAHRRARPTRTCSTTPAATSTTSTCSATRRSRPPPRLLASLGTSATTAPALRRARPRARALQRARRGDSRTSSGTRCSGSSHVYSFLSQIVSFTDTEPRARLPLRRALALYLPGPSDGAARPRHRGRADASAHRDDLRRLSLARPRRAARSRRSSTGAGRSTSRSRSTSRRSSTSSTSASASTSTDADQLLFDQFEQSWVADAELAAQAQAATTSTTSGSSSTASS